jgi:hypothetical protein
MPSILCPEPLPCGDRLKGSAHYRTHLAFWGVYADYFWGMLQGGTRTRRRVKHALLRTMDTVLRHLDSDNSVYCSIKKMVKGGSSWATTKVILGWIINTLENTISLMAHRLVFIREIMASISATQHRDSLKKWQQVLGELRPMALSIPAVIDIFSVLQKALKTSDGNKVHLTSHMQAFQADLYWLVEDAGACPTAINELVQDEVPYTQGGCVKLQREVWVMCNLCPFKRPAPSPI